MHGLSIRQLERLTGISVATLRAWEHRYWFSRPAAKKGVQRLYTTPQLIVLLCAAFLYQNGHKAADLSALSEADLILAVEATPLTRENLSTAVQRLVSAALTFNEATFLQRLASIQAVAGFDALITQAGFPLLHCLGLLWEEDHFLAAAAQFATGVLHNRIISETETLAPTQTGNPELVLFCPAPAAPETSLLFINYLLRKNGWRVLNLGSGYTPGELQQAALFPGVRYLYLHLLAPTYGPALDDYLAALRTQFPGHTIIVSGTGTGQSKRNLLRVHRLQSDAAIYTFIQTRNTEK